MKMEMDMGDGTWTYRSDEDPSHRDQTYSARRDVQSPSSSCYPSSLQLAVEGRHR